MISDQAQQRRAHLAMLAQTIMIGPAYTLGQISAKAFHPLALMGLRITASALLLLPLFFVYGGREHFRPTRRQWLGFGVLTLMGILLNQFLFLLGLRLTTPANSSLLFALTPMAVLLIAVFLLRDEKLNAQKLVGVALALGGVAVLFIEKGLQLQGDVLLGNLLTIAAMLCWALYMAYSRKLLRAIHPVQVTAVLMVLGMLFFIPINLYILPRQDWAAIPAIAWWGLVYLILISSVVSYLLISYAMARIPASAAAVYVNLQPISATLFSVLVIGEQLSWLFVLAALLTLTGIYVLSRAQRVGS